MVVRFGAYSTFIRLPGPLVETAAAHHIVKQNVKGDLRIHVPQAVDDDVKHG